MLIGPGIMSIPPNCWGAVETLIWDYSIFLKDLGHIVDIVNTQNYEEIVQTVNNGNYDVAHLHYDVFVDIIPYLKAKIICITSHYPYIDKPNLWGNYRDIFLKICNLVKSNNIYYYSISEKDRDTFLKFDDMKLFINKFIVMKNGVDTNSFLFSTIPQFSNKSLTLGKIEQRKRQYLTYSLKDIDYIGRGPCDHPDYKGEPKNIRNILTNYANLVLLSDGENGSPLVVKEAMAAGLGLVLSESSANELPRDLPWLTVIPENQLNDPLILNKLIKDNRNISIQYRESIRKWCKDNWDWKILVANYVKNIERCLNNI